MASSSPVWNFFTIETPKSSKAKCNECDAEVPRGGQSVSSYNTTNLIKHLKKYHAEQHAELERLQSQRPYSQQRIEAAFKKREKLKDDDPTAMKITEKVIYFVVLDDQPLSVVENKGFRSLVEHLAPKYNIPSRKTITSVHIPGLFDKVSAHLKQQLNGVNCMSFTTDIWSSDNNLMSLISLTVHWVNPETYTFNSAVLNVKECRGSHTADMIKDIMQEMLDSWEIPLAKAHVVMRDNASNMKKAMTELQVDSLGCFAHTLQLVVHEGLLVQRSVADALAKGRSIVTHFKHSPLAQSLLEDTQEELGQEIRRLQQDVKTRWNSSLYMIQSLLEQKRPLYNYIADHNNNLTMLTANEWQLLEKVAKVLEPFEEITKTISSATSTLADVIPNVATLKRSLTKTSDDSGIKTMKKTLLEAVNTRFSSTEDEPLYSVATLVDPRYKDRFFSDAVTAKRARDALMREMRKLETELLTDGAANPASTAASTEGEPGDAGPAAKVPCREEAAGSSQGRPADSSQGRPADSSQGRPADSSQRSGRPADRQNTKKKSSLRASYDEILAEKGDRGGTGSQSDSALLQMQKYMKESVIDVSQSPFQYWEINHDRFPTLAAIAVRFLSAPSTSVESERLFSAAAIVVDEKRNRLKAENAEKIIFLKKNLIKYA